MLRLLRLIGQLIVAVFIVVFFFFFFVFAERLWQPAAPLLAILFYLPLTVNLLSFPLRPRLWRQSYIHGTIGPDVPGGVFSALFVHLLCFSFISRGIWMYAGPGNFEFQVQVSPAPILWLLYGVDNFVRAAVFDVAEIYGFTISGIDHSPSVPMATFVLTYRLGLSLGLLSIFVTYLKRHFRSSTPPETKAGSAAA